MNNRDKGKDITLEFILWIAGTGGVLVVLHWILDLLDLI